MAAIGPWQPWQGSRLRTGCTLRIISSPSALCTTAVMARVSPGARAQPGQSAPPARSRTRPRSASDEAKRTSPEGSRIITRSTSLCVANRATTSRRPSMSRLSIAFSRVAWRSCVTCAAAVWRSLTSRSR
ncbi:MAG: hypothetical protein R3C69_10695 [Geminicoccaceae bacterium]